MLRPVALPPDVTMEDLARAPLRPVKKSPDEESRREIGDSPRGTGVRTGKQRIVTPWS